MIFDRNENKPVIALLGAGSMGTATIPARRGQAGSGKRPGKNRKADSY